MNNSSVILIGTNYNMNNSSIQRYSFFFLYFYKYMCLYIKATTWSAGYADAYNENKLGQLCGATANIDI